MILAIIKESKKGHLEKKFKKLMDPTTYSIINFLPTIPGHVSKAYQFCSNKCREIGNEFWKDYGKPLYERKIAPLNSFSWTILAGSTLSAIAIQLIPKKILSRAFSPLLSVGIVILGFKWVDLRLNSHFNEEAKKILENINQELISEKSTQEKLVTIKEHVKHLLKPQFEMLKEKTKNLDEKFDLLEKQASLKENSSLHEEAKFEFKQALEKFKPENKN